MLLSLPTLLAISAGLLLTTPARATTPDCTGVERWATSVAFGELKSARFTDNERLDFTKTKTTRLASEKIGKDLYRQVHHVVFTEKTGNKIVVITVNDASSEECSMSGVQVFVVSRELGRR